MEPAAARASITFLQDAGLDIKVFVTDRSIPLATFDKDRSQITVVDRPTQLIYIWIFICWVGGGDPCGVAELCKSAPSDQKKQAKTNIFSKYPCHVHEDCLEAKNGTKNLMKPPKKTCLFCASEPSGSKFLKRGIPRFGNFWNEGSIHFSSFARNINFLSMLSCASWDSQILNCIEEI